VSANDGSQERFQEAFPNARESETSTSAGRGNRLSLESAPVSCPAARRDGLVAQCLVTWPLRPADNQPNPCGPRRRGRSFYDTESLLVANQKPAPPAYLHR
jgi:hypothetical protein